jgi:hypothetical protein
MNKLLTAFAAGLLFASCVPSTPQTRIQQNPQKFSTLSENHKALVSHGQITRGMTADAVFLAWGRPSGIFHGSKDGKISDRWDYAATYPVQVTNFYGGYGYGGCGPYGRFGYSAIDFGFGPEIAYLPYRVGSVWFINRRVDAWERAR